MGNIVDIKDLILKLRELSGRDLENSIEAGRYLVDAVWGGVSGWKNTSKNNTMKSLLADPGFPFKKSTAIRKMHLYVMDQEFGGLAKKWPTLSMSHFEAVIYWDDRQEWLYLAEANNLSLLEMKEARAKEIAGESHTSNRVTKFEHITDRFSELLSSLKDTSDVREKLEVINSISSVYDAIRDFTMSLEVKEGAPNPFLDLMIGEVQKTEIRKYISILTNVLGSEGQNGQEILSDIPIPEETVHVSIPEPEPIEEPKFLSEEDKFLHFIKEKFSREIVLPHEFEDWKSDVKDSFEDEWSDLWLSIVNILFTDFKLRKESYELAKNEEKLRREHAMKYMRGGAKPWDSDKWESISWQEMYSRHEKPPHLKKILEEKKEVAGHFASSIFIKDVKLRETVGLLQLPELSSTRFTTEEDGFGNKVFYEKIEQPEPKRWVVFEDIPEKMPFGETDLASYREIFDKRTGKNLLVFKPVPEMIDVKEYADRKEFIYNRKENNAARKLEQHKIKERQRVQDNDSCPVPASITGYKVDKGKSPDIQLDGPNDVEQPEPPKRRGSVINFRGKVVNINEEDLDEMLAQIKVSPI